MHHVQLHAQKTPQAIVARADWLVRALAITSASDPLTGPLAGV